MDELDLVREQLVDAELDECVGLAPADLHDRPRPGDRGPDRLEIATRLGLVAVLVNLVANLTLVWILAGPGLALGTSITATFQSLVACWILTRRLDAFPWKSISHTLLRTILATAVMTAACLAASVQIDIASPFIGKVVALSLPLGAGTTAFLLTAKLIGLTDPFELLRRKRHD